MRISDWSSDVCSSDLALADNSWNEQEQLMVAELARSVSRPDLGVRLARNARKSSDSWLWTAGYPRLPLSPLLERHWTMIHAITRQEKIGRASCRERVCQYV